ncbi:MAG TPA: hypothetical protein DIW77_20260 [Chromatiaceae bacterium]|jgi:hypothetical protein|nr:MAG: hypothetical protein N838_23495 [Thiohalocapsa sp. PB-PSB1]HCS92300.1 hypothetical protein [Chromatiaceae bacterium]
MEALIEGQNTTLRQVVMRTAAVLRVQGPGAEARSATAGSPPESPTPAPPRHGNPRAWLSTGMLMGSGATMAVAVIAWLQLGGQ